METHTTTRDEVKPTGDVRFDRDDVTLEEIPVELCSNCEEGPATHYLQIDLRAVGWTTTIGDRTGYCGECGKEELEAIRATMPERPNEDGVELVNYGQCSVCRADQIGKRHEHPCE